MHIILSFSNKEVQVEIIEYSHVLFHKHSRKKIYLMMSEIDVNLPDMFQQDVLEEFCSSYRISSCRTYITSDEYARRHGCLHITDQQKLGVQTAEGAVKLMPSQRWPPGIYNDKYPKFYEVCNLFSFLWAKEPMQ